MAATIRQGMPLWVALVAEFGSQYFTIAFNVDYEDPEKEESVRRITKSTLVAFMTLNEALLAQYEQTLSTLEQHPAIQKSLAE